MHNIHKVSTLAVVTHVAQVTKYQPAVLGNIMILTRKDAMIINVKFFHTEILILSSIS